MDLVAKIDVVELPGCIPPTMNAFLPLLNAKKEAIFAHPKRTFRYGSTDRHQLDVYYPTAPFRPQGATSGHTSEGTPVLIFIYGGGFIIGDRNSDPPFEMLYGNMGAYYASQGFAVVFPDYRLAPAFKFPSALEDIRDALNWVIDNPAKLIYPRVQGREQGFIPPPPNTRNMFMMGQSAGAAHVIATFLHSEILPSSIRSRLVGAVIFSGPYHFEMQNHNFEENCESHWGSMEATHANCARGLFRRLFDLAEAKGAGISGEDKIAFVKSFLPLNILFLDAEKDSGWLKVATKDLLNDFVDRLELSESSQDSRPTIRYVEAKGHNHASPVFSLGTGQGEEWAVQVRDWAGEVLVKAYGSG